MPSRAISALHSSAPALRLAARGGTAARVTPDRGGETPAVGSLPRRFRQFGRQQRSRFNRERVVIPSMLLSGNPLFFLFDPLDLGIRALPPLGGGARAGRGSRWEAFELRERRSRATPPLHQELRGSKNLILHPLFGGEVAWGRRWHSAGFSIQAAECAPLSADIPVRSSRQDTEQRAITVPLTLQQNWPLCGDLVPSLIGPGAPISSGGLGCWFRVFRGDRIRLKQPAWNSGCCLPHEHGQGLLGARLQPTRPLRVEENCGGAPLQGSDCPSANIPKFWEGMRQGDRGTNKRDRSNLR